MDAGRVGGGRGGYVFRHAFLAEVANGELFHGERDRLHAAFVSSCREVSRRRPGQPAELAYHWVAARDR